MKQKTNKPCKTAKHTAELLNVAALQKEYQIRDIDSLLDATAEQLGEHCQHTLRDFVVRMIGSTIYPDILFAGTTFLAMLHAITNTDKPTSTFLAIVQDLPRLGYDEQQALELVKLLADYISPYRTEFTDWENQRYCYDLAQNYYEHQTQVDKNRIRQTLSQQLAAELENLPQILAGLDDEKRVQAQMKLLPLLLGDDKPLAPKYGND